MNYDLTPDERGGRHGVCVRAPDAIAATPFPCPRHRARESDGGLSNAAATPSTRRRRRPRKLMMYKCLVLIQRRAHVVPLHEELLDPPNTLDGRLRSMGK